MRKKELTTQVALLNDYLALAHTHLARQDDDLDEQRQLITSLQDGLEMAKQELDFYKIAYSIAAGRLSAHEKADPTEFSAQLLETVAREMVETDEPF